MAFTLPASLSKHGGDKIFLTHKFMVKKAPPDAFVFIVGSPRSGTTILGELLDKHQHISQWYEPYFVWDHFFRTAPDDERTEADATPEIRNWIYRNFTRYKRRRNCAVLVDKSPRNSLKIPFIITIFPQAKFIHLLRDGRDVTLSINKEWLRRQNILQNPLYKGRFSYGEAYQVIKNFLRRQPFIKDKIGALWFETHGHIINKAKHLNRLRWNGKIGWGPRFAGWETIYAQSSLLQFNAYQWLNCVERINTHWKLIQKRNRIIVRYEDLIKKPSDTIAAILEFLELDHNESFFKSLPKLKADNYRKWKTEFSRERLEEISPILTQQLIAFSYAESEKWTNES
jgi:hypothetical protein